MGSPAIRARRLLAASVLCGAAAAAAVLAVPSVSASGRPTTLHFREPTTNGSAINAAGRANRQGDYLAWDDPLKDANTGKVAGHVAGVCMLVNVKTQLYDCGPVTYILSNGTIFANGLLYGSGKAVPGPIIGGTGSYKNASGTITVTAVSPAITDHVIRLDG
jgi:hypothetical protein